MINKIIDGISVRINAIFGDSYEIYTENVEQGLSEPCFSVLCINPTIEQFLGKRYFRTNQFCVHYFPKTNEKQYESFSVVERLQNALEYITVDGDAVRGTQMHSEMVDGVLSFFVNYDMFVCKSKEDSSYMETVSYDADVKG